MLLRLGPVGPLGEVGNQLTEVDTKTTGDRQEAGEAQIPLASFDRGDEGEVESDSLRQPHLAEAHLLPPSTNSVAQLDLSRSALRGQAHGDGVDLSEVSGTRAATRNRR